MDLRIRLDEEHEDWYTCIRLAYPGALPSVIVSAALKAFVFGVNADQREEALLGAGYKMQVSGGGKNKPRMRCSGCRDVYGQAKLQPRICNTKTKYFCSICIVNGRHRNH